MTDRIEAHVWRISFVVILGSIMSTLDTTIVNVALETLGRELHSPLSSIQWVITGYMLSLAAVIGIAWAAGFHAVYRQLLDMDPIWLPVAFGMEVAAYFGYVVAYREVARVQGGPRLGIGRAGAIVAAGFGVFVVRGGFVVDRHALEDAGLEPREARVRVLGLGALEYAVLAPAAALAAVIILARGSTHPSLGFTLPWAIAVPLGFLAAFAALGLRHRVRDEGGWRAALRHALDAVNMLRHLKRWREHAARA